MSQRIHLILATLVIAAAVLSSCATPPELRAYDGLRPGMSRAEVEYLLGKPEAVWQISDRFITVYDFEEDEIPPRKGRPFSVIFRNGHVCDYGAYERSDFPKLLGNSD